MLDYEILKKLNINAETLDLDKSYYSFNTNTCYLDLCQVLGHKKINHYRFKAA